MTYGSGINYQHPSWSPDGTKIAFSTRQRGENRFVLNVMNADGSGLTQVHDSQGSLSKIDWSPDGTKVVFSEGVTDYEIFVINIDGSNLFQLTDTPNDNEVGVEWGPSAP